MRFGRSKVPVLVSALVLASGAILLVASNDKVQKTETESQTKWGIGKILRTPDTLVLQSLNSIVEFLKGKLHLGGASSQLSTEEFQWLNAAKEEICAKFGISPVPELRICDDGRMLAQAGPHGCPGFGKGWVLLSKGVLETLPRREVVAVLAHELTHVVKNHHLKRGFLILDFYRLMMLWSLKQNEDSEDLQTIAASLAMWFLVSLRSRSQEIEADRHMLDIVRPSTAFSALARMHYPLDDPEEVLQDAREMVKKFPRWLRIKMFFSCASHPCLPLRVEALEAAEKARESSAFSLRAGLTEVHGLTAMSLW